MLNDKECYSVYIHTNKINNKKYVGITSINPMRRWKGGSGYRNQPVFFNAIKKYGWNSFQHEVVADGLTLQQACDMQKQLIQQFDSTNSQFGYNTQTGGIASNQHIRQKISKGNKGKIVSQQTKQKLRLANLGKKLSQETKDKISEMSKKPRPSAKGRKKPYTSGDQPVPVVCVETGV